MILPVVKIPSKNLFSPSKKIDNFDQKLHKLVRDMKNTLIAAHNPEGVGLAATQVNINIRLFIIRPKKREKIREFINPEILSIKQSDISKSNDKEASQIEEKTTLEGCLSVDKIWSEITRPQKVHLKYQTLDKKSHIEWFEGFEAVIIQHEVDHLNGILFTRRALEQNTPLFEEKRGKLHKIDL